MDDSSEMEPSSPISDKNVKAPDVTERTKEKIEAIQHSTKSHDHHKESHGMRVDIDENTSINNVKAPNVFERVQEEIEALVQTIHSKKEANTHDSSSKGTENRDGTVKVETKDNASEEKKAGKPNLIRRVKEELQSIIHKGRSPNHHHHHKETHGTSDDISEHTPISEVKGPNVFERAKEEVEAIVQTIHRKKESKKGVHSPQKES